MRRGARRVPGAALVAALAVACTATPPAEPGAASRRPDTLKVALRADVTGFFPSPSMANEGFSFGVNFNLFEGLVSFDHQLRIHPALAERWETPDERTFVFTLRPGLRFSDGTPVTARDVAASLRAATERRWANREAFQAVTSIETLDEQQVQLRSGLPYIVLLSRLPRGFVLPEAAIEQGIVPPPGTGPYVLASRDPGRGFVFERNRHYRGAAPGFSRVEFEVVPEAAERERRLRAGEVDLINDVAPEMARRLRADPAVRVATGSGTRVLFLGMAVRRAPFSDPRVREALELAIDRAELARRVYGGEPVELATQVVGRGIVGFDPALPAPVLDRERSRALLAAAGFAGGLEVTLDGSSNRYVGDEAILHEVARQLALVGVRVKVNAADKADFFARLDRRESAFHLLGWAVETGEAGDALEYLFRTPDGGVLGTENTTGTSDPDLDRLIDEAARATSIEARTATLMQAMRRVAALRPVVPLVVQPEGVAFAARIAWQPPLGNALELATARPAR